MSGGAAEAQAAADAVVPTVTQPEAAVPDCNEAASLFSSVPKECIQLKPTPALTTLVRSAISDQLANVTSATVEGALEATGNAALVQLATTSAFTPEQLEMLKTMSASDNAETRAAVESIKDTLSKAVSETTKAVGDTVLPPVLELSDEVVRKVSMSFLNAVSDIPGVGIVLAGLGLVDTAVQGIGDAVNVVEKAQSAMAPVTDAIATVQGAVGELANAASAATSAATADESVSAATGSVNESVNVDEAPPSVNEANEAEHEHAPGATADESVSAATGSVNVDAAPRSVPLNYNRELYGPHRNDYPEGDKGYAEFEAASKKFQEDKQKKRESAIAAAKSANTSTLPKMQTGRVVDAQVITPETQGITVGGSRKRRRIHKLSRRIERTLRRVQKKYGLGLQDKGDFLRRTLKHHKR